MKVFPAQLCAILGISSVAWGQQVAPPDTSKAETPQTPTTPADVDPAIAEPGGELHIGTGSVAWNAMLRDADQRKALQAVRDRRDIYYRMAAAQGQPAPVIRTADEFLAANPPPVVRTPLSEMPDPPRPPAPRPSYVPEFENDSPPAQSVGLPKSKKKKNLFSWLKQREAARRGEGQLDNPYISPGSVPAPTVGADEYLPSAEELGSESTPVVPEQDPVAMDQAIAAATGGGSAQQQKSKGGLFKKLFGKKASPGDLPTAAVEVPNEPAPSVPDGQPYPEPAESTPPVPTDYSVPDGDFSIPTAPPIGEGANAEVPSVSVRPVE